MSLTLSELQLLSNTKQPRAFPPLAASVNPALRGYVMAARPAVRPLEPPSHAGERVMLANAFANGMRQFISLNTLAGVKSAAELASSYLVAHNLNRQSDYAKLHAALQQGYDDVIRPAFAEFLMGYIHKRFTGAKGAVSNYAKSGLDINAAQSIFTLLMSPSAKKVKTQEAIDLAFALLPELSTTTHWFSTVVDRAVMLNVGTAVLNKLYELDAMDMF